MGVCVRGCGNVWDIFGVCVGVCVRSLCLFARVFVFLCMYLNIKLCVHVFVLEYDCVYALKRVCVCPSVCVCVHI